jgi:hypothetical protein
VILVVVEGGDRGGLVACDLREDLELQLLLALAGGEHAPAAPEERIGCDVELDLQAEAAEQRQRPLAPDFAPALHSLRLAQPDHLALVEHLQPRRIA